MSRRMAIFIAAMVVACTALPASAIPLQITVQGQLAIDELTSSFFGITDASVPIQFSFGLDGDDALSLAPGTTLVPPSGPGLDSPVHLFSASSLNNFIATIGSVSFTSADLRAQSLGNTAYSFDLLLLGNLNEGGLSGALFTLNSDSGTLNIGDLSCNAAACVLGNFGYGESRLLGEGGIANISGLQVFTQDVTPTEEPPTAVPEPATLGILAFGLFALFLSRSRRLLSRFDSRPDARALVPSVAAFT